MICPASLPGSTAYLSNQQCGLMGEVARVAMRPDVLFADGSRGGATDRLPKLRLRRLRGAIWAKAPRGPS
jgi:hypothetical protein